MISRKISSVAEKSPSILRAYVQCEIYSSGHSFHHALARGEYWGAFLSAAFVTLRTYLYISFSGIGRCSLPSTINAKKYFAMSEITSDLLIGSSGSQSFSMSQTSVSFSLYTHGRNKVSSSFNASYISNIE